jgi:orotidine-5'-phosphate decarboxylase
MNNRDVIIACDFFTKRELFVFLKKFKNERPFLKIGYQLYFSEGNKLIKKLKNKGYSIFLDLKLHDIPNTIINGIKSLSKLNVDFISLHASNGSKALKEAVSVRNNTKLLAITVLTSFDQQTITKELQTNKSINELVESFAKMTSDSNINGIVCSVNEAKLIKSINPNLIVVCPGIRLNSDSQDQKRIATPLTAKQNGVDYIVVGREITQSPNPFETYQKIKKEFI